MNFSWIFICPLLLCLINFQFTKCAVDDDIYQNGEGGFRAVSLRYHNYYRHLYGLGPLELKNELNRMAHEHAEKLAAVNSEIQRSDSGHPENLWSHRGELRSLSLSCRDAVNSWYTGSRIPANAVFLVDEQVLKSNSTRYVGIGAGTGVRYTVIVADYQ